MRDVEGGDLSRRIPVETVDEIGRLSHGFNRMLERLSQADARSAPSTSAWPTRSRRRRTICPRRTRRWRSSTACSSTCGSTTPRKVRLAALGQLAAQLAHEIGTPLSSVSGHLQLALLAARAAAGAARAAGRGGARDRAHQQDRARLPRLDAAARARAPADRAAAPARGGGRARRRASTPRKRASRHLERLATGRRRRRSPTRACCGRSSSTCSPTPPTPSDDDGRVAQSRRAPAADERVADHRAATRATASRPRTAAASSSLLHDQGTRQGHRPRPRHLPRAGRGARRAASPSRARPGRARPSPCACRARARPRRRAACPRRGG